MKKLHVYTVYMDDGDAFKVTVPAESMEIDVITRTLAAVGLER